jgi:shikimate kinase
VEVAAGTVFAWDCAGAVTASLEVVAVAVVWAFDCDGFDATLEVAVAFTFAAPSLDVTGAFDDPLAAATGGSFSLDFFLRNITKENSP